MENKKGIYPGTTVRLKQEPKPHVYRLVLAVDLASLRALVSVDWYPLFNAGRISDARPKMVWFSMDEMEKVTI